MDELTRVAIRRWIEKAERDLITARTMLALDPPVTDVVCFHCHQCAEKAFKAFLVRSSVHIEKTHYLRRLLILCMELEPSFSALEDPATNLSDYVATRYPDDWREIPGDEASRAMQDAIRILEFVRGRLD